MSRTAILVDGAFFLARYRKVWGDRDPNDARTVAKTVFGMALEHLKALDRPRESLYRIFFYDCPPLDKRFVRPVSGDSIDFGRTAAAEFRRDLHDQLRRQRKMALRLGRLAERGEWKLKYGALQQLRDGELHSDDLGDEHFEPDMRQTQVDMKIGIDIAALTYKKLVDQIILVAGDADFIPAAKLARYEGIDFILDPMWQGIAPDLHEHIDGLQSVCPRPF
ncbi:NYN domain-containing protein [Dyella sp. A6]|uniref:NYN domain-containing protein n=1 Tax=Dyella aluminiiresistens TaxID=3069105 RepID=UPI002E7A5F78|nr:NYN domain-containing protein [Dyella sp. A6]